jgi:adenylate cyclase
VNLASRIADTAQSGQVLTTRQTVDSLPPAIRSTCRMLHPLEFKGIDGDVPIFEVIWNMEATLTMVADGGPIGRLDPARALLLAHRGKEVRIDAVHRVARIGRDPANDLVVPAKTASRMHARIHLRDSQFVLVDASVNGTFVRFDGKPEICLRRGETMLIGQGVIGLGESTTNEGAETVVFAQL